MISGISTTVIQSALLRSIQTTQREMFVAQIEVQTGRYADIAERLGRGTSTPIALLREVNRIDSILDTNKSASTRLAATQLALGSVASSTQSLFDSLAAAKGNAQGMALAAQSAMSQLGAIGSALSTTVSGQYIFSGLNTDQPPVNQTSPIPAGPAMDTAFISRFGFAKTDALAASITPSAFSAFVTTDIEPMFLGAGWSSTLSNASDEAIVSRITLARTIETSLSANETGLRQSLYAAALSANFLDTSLNQATKESVVNIALQQSASSVSALAELQGRAGFAQQQLSDADVRLSAQSDLFAGMAEDITGVDPHEAAVRLNELVTRLETSFALTQKIQSLSILDYLR